MGSQLHRRNRDGASVLLVFVALLILTFSALQIASFSGRATPPATRDSTPGLLASDPTTTSNVVNISQVKNFTTNHFLPAEFYGVNVRADSQFNEYDALNLSDTDALTWRFPGGNLGEDFNYNSSTNASSRNRESVILAKFIELCVTFDCHAILQLPAEINNSHIDAYDVNYIEHSLRYYVNGNLTVGFKPWLWEFGNEPALWTKFGLPWHSWNNQSGTKVTNTSYARIVPGIIKAIRSVDPTASIDPLGGVGTGAANDNDWVKAVMSAVSNASLNISYISIHSYPDGLSNDTMDVSAFYSPIYSAKNKLPTLLPELAANITKSCKYCTPVGILISEAGASTGLTNAPLETGFPMALWDAADAVQSAYAGAASIDYFAYHNGYPGSFIASRGGTLDPSYFFFKDISPYLGSTVQNVSISSNDGGMLLVGAYQGTGANRSLLIVNLDTENNTTIKVSANSGFPVWGDIEFYSWAAGMPEPLGHLASFLSPTTIAPESMELITVYPGRAAVPLAPAGPFIANHNGTQVRVTYSQPIGPIERDSIAYGTPNNSSPYCNNVTSVTTIVATGGWNISGLAPGTPYCFSVRAKTYAGFGPPSNLINFTTPKVYRVTFKENGLPTGAAWRVKVAGSTLTSNGRKIDFELCNSTYSYSVPNLTGFTNSQGGTFTVSGSPLTILEHFSHIYYNVTFNESTLPHHWPWNVTIGMRTYSTIATTISIDLSDGNYSYSVGVPGGGYTASGGKFTVNGSPVRITVKFT
jgi:hypothetical protein